MMELIISRLTNGSHKSNSSVSSGGMRGAFQILTTTLLSLLLPLSFLLLARLSTAQYLLSVSDDYTILQPEPSFLCSLFLYTTIRPTILHVLVSLITVASLTQALTGKSHEFNAHQQRPVLTRSRLCGAWILLCLVQVCVGLGIEGSIASGIDGSSFGQESSFLGRIMFFFGLHEAMMFWGATVVKPVVDDTIFGHWREARPRMMVEKVAVGLSYGGLWWWRLREEVESLVMVPELKRELMMRIGMEDFIGWWLYYLTATIGIVRVIRGLTLTTIIFTQRRPRIEEDQSQPADEKV